MSCVNQDTRKGYRIAREGVTFFPRRPGDAPPAPEPRPAPEQPTTEPDRSGCDPNYEGACVPIVPYDLDCADIDGTVYVRGDDPHRFDGDGDGWAASPSRCAPGGSRDMAAPARSAAAEGGVRSVPQRCTPLRHSGRYDPPLISRLRPLPQAARRAPTLLATDSWPRYRSIEWISSDGLSTRMSTSGFP